MVTMKHTRDSIAKLEQEREQFKRERDSLIKDVEKFREEIEELKKYNSDLEEQVDKWFEEWHDTKVENDLLELKLQEMKEDYRIVNSKYTNLTEHIRLKALHNPSVSRYKDLICFINDMEDK